MNYRTMGAIAAYAIAAATLLVLGVLACFATLWGVNRLALFPLYFIGLLLCGGAVAVAVTIRKSKSDTTISCAWRDGPVKPDHDEGSGRTMTKGQAGP